jgi:hypothetical protein
LYGDQFVDGGIHRDEETHEIIDCEYLRRCYDEIEPVLAFIQNVESGMVTITLKEYAELPPVVLVTWGLFKSEINKKRQRENKKMMMQYGR